MARKIEATPTLRGNDAKRFINELHREPTKKEINFRKHAEKTFSKVKFSH